MIRTALLVLLPLFTATRASKPCILDDRLNSLRCHETDFRTVRSALAEVYRDIFSLRIDFCDIRVVTEPLLKDEADTSDLRDIALVNSGLEAMAEDTFVGFEVVLERLDLSGNRLSHLPTAILNLTRLASLDLSNNRIKQLPHGSAFNNLNALVSLNLGLNQ